METRTHRPRPAPACRRRALRNSGILEADERHPYSRFPHRLHPDRHDEILQRRLDDRACTSWHPRSPPLHRAFSAGGTHHVEQVFHVPACLPLHEDVGDQGGRDHALGQHLDHALLKHAAWQPRLQTAPDPAARGSRRQPARRPRSRLSRPTEPSHVQSFPQPHGLGRA